MLQSMGLQRIGHDLVTEQQCGILVPPPGIEHVLPVVDRRVLTIGLPGKSPKGMFPFLLNKISQLLLPTLGTSQHLMLSTYRYETSMEIQW